MSSHDTEILSQTIWENLVEYDIDGVLRPQLAKALPTISADKLTYAFELRDDVTFQNGQKLTSDDVKYSFEYLIDPAHKASRGSLFNRHLACRGRQPDQAARHPEGAVCALADLPDQVHGHLAQGLPGEVWATTISA